VRLAFVEIGIDVIFQGPGRGLATVILVVSVYISPSSMSTKMTYMVGIGVGLAIHVLGGGAIGVGRCDSRVSTPDGGSIDRDGEDSGDDGEELCREHHGVG